MIGQRIGPYLATELLGMGGMGAVYKARDTRLERWVALKVVRTDREDRSGVSPEARLLAEARAAATLRHPNIVAVFDAGVADGQTYVAMELIDGRPLRAWVGDAGVALATRKRWLAEIGAALSTAHRAGFVHRDVKPENVLIDAEGHARVLDFGLVKRTVLDTMEPTADQPLQQSTLEGRVVGTPSYMAPEQLAGGEPDARWDQFAWGVMAYEVLTGQHPRMTVAMPGPTAHLTQTPKLPSAVAAELTASDDAVVMTAMSTDATRRHANMDAAVAALRGERRRESSSPSTVSTVTRPPRPLEPLEPPARAPSRAWVPIVIAVAAAGGGVMVGRAMTRPAQTSAASPAAASLTAPASSSATLVAMTTTSSAPSSPASSAAATPSETNSIHASALPPDYGTRCMCMGGVDGALCPLGANLHVRTCACLTEASSNLANAKGEYSFTGRDLADGQACKGVDFDGSTRSGTLARCESDCDERSFAGLHRTNCRGLSRLDGAERPGTLFCYTDGRIMR